MIDQFINFVIRPPRADYNPDQFLWEKEFSLGDRKYKREDFELKNERGHTLRCSHYTPSSFPDGAPLPCVIYCHGNRDVALEYLKSSTKMVRKLLEILFENLGVTLDEAKFESLTGLKMVNMNFYPSCPNPELTVGVGRHSDMGTLTVLLQDGIGGLYVKLEQGVEDEWIEIPPIPGALVINVGDTMQIISNGRYKSAEHRVRTTSSESRVSVPLFATPKPSEKIGPLPQIVESDGVAHYKQVMFGDYMKNFFGKAHEGKKSLDFALTDSS